MKKTSPARKIPGVARSLSAIDRLRWGLRVQRMSRTGQRRVALASFPRSGNTWFRFLLESATGELTGGAGTSVARVLPRTGDGIVIKTHGRDAFRYTDAIHLVRNPFDVLDSFYDWKRNLGWTWRFGELSWEDFIVMFTPRWRDHTRHWLACRANVHRVRYEDCVEDPVEHFGRVLRWLGREVTLTRLEAAVEETSFDKLKRQQSEVSEVGSKFFRQGRANSGSSRFTQEQRRWVVDVLRAELEACGYDGVIRESEKE